MSQQRKHAVWKKKKFMVETWIYTLLPLGPGGEEKRPGVSHGLN
jgi:hypothetical protein